MANDDTRRDDPFRWLLDVGAALVASTSSGDSLQRVAAAIGLAMNVSQVDIQSLDPEREVVVQEAVWERDGLTEQHLAYIGTEIPLADLGLDRVVQRRAMDETHIDDPDLADSEREGFERWGYLSTLDAPLMIGDEVIGVLGITEGRYVRRFKAAERDRFAQLAALTAAAIRNRRIAVDQRVRSERLAVLLALIGRLAEGDVDGAARVAGEGCVAQLDAARAAVWQITPDAAPVLRGRSGEVPAETPSAQGSAGEVATEASSAPSTDDLPSLLDTRLSNEPYHLVTEGSLEPGDPINRCLAQQAATALLAVPLVFLDRKLGWLLVTWRDPVPGCDEDELAFAVAVAEQLAAGLESERPFSADEAGPTGPTGPSPSLSL